ncbi:Nif3-like dinuclear metal center hexameric protein [Micrococcoides hystricis]|uniref:GTP cyclohydrolase 1 type 2 homolog n=1 Tax=Micrococcoides hystricis TaxID=1572761 RepID=A0ABV6PEC8_9MICC
MTTSSSASLTLSEVLEIVEQLWPAHLAQNWDACGLVTGRPEAPIEHIHFALDPVQSVADEAVALGADLLITHHPLYLKPTNSVAATSFKGKVVHTLIENKVALLAAHTNADSVVGGVSDVLCDILDIQDREPLQIAPNGLVEEGIGRVGTLPEPKTLEQLASTLASVLPAVAGGIRAAGDRNGIVNRVAIVGGAGDSLFDQVRSSGADVYITSDLRHHPASEAREAAVEDRPYLIDISHFAAEWMWLPAGAEALERALHDAGHSTRVTVSGINTDPWDFVLMPQPDAR